MDDKRQIIFFVTIITLVSEGAFEVTSQQQKKLNKRYEVDFPTCIENFDIHTDTIIRAQDSRAIGGRYINETEVSSREECLKLCCQTSLCDVFIFEEKNPGSCYLFDCGSSDDFKCKFNPHKHYTSGIMAVNRHVAELESQVKLSKHEEELAGLRKSPATMVQHTTVVAPPTQAAIIQTTSTSTPRPAASTSVQTNASTNVAGRRCSRYQFECRSSGECIAIYNACDGIPQCTDGSDEGPELACPSPVSTMPPPPPPPSASVSAPKHGQPEGPQTYNPQFRQPLPQPVWPPAWQQHQQQQQQFPVPEPPKSAEFPQQPLPVQPPQQVNPPQVYQQPVQQAQPDAHKFYSREGDYGGIHDPAAQWPAQQFHNQAPINPIPQTFHRPGPYPGAEYEDPQNSHIFNHKGSVLMNDADTGSANYGGYGGAEGKVGGAAYYNGAVPAFRQPQQQQQQQWQRPRVPAQEHESLLGHSIEDELHLGSHAHFGVPPLQPPSQQQQVPGAVGGAPDYYNYEEGGPPQRGNFHHHQMHPQPPVVMESKPDLKAQHRPPALMEGQSEAAATAEAPKPPPVLAQKLAAPADHSQQEITTETTTEHPLEVAHSHGHFSGEGSKKKALPPHLPSPLDSEEVLQIPDGAADKPGGAYLSLSVGLAVTALLVILISCRLRVVRRRLRRGGGKSPYAHDADFLVNGMYL